MSNQSQELSDPEKLKKLFSYWRVHNNDHTRDISHWLNLAQKAGHTDVSNELAKVIKLYQEIDRHIESAGENLQHHDSGSSAHRRIDNKATRHNKPDSKRSETPAATIRFKQIGEIETPYSEQAPYQPVENDTGEFCLRIYPQYSEGLRELDRFRYIYVLYFIHKAKQNPSLVVSPSWAPDTRVGTFASRSPLRPNRLGLSIVCLKRVAGNVIYTSGLDVFNGTPVLDIKPYIRDLDAKTDANYGWLDDFEDRNHLMLHIKGIPHEY